ncbi:PLP-dependent aminotransferase family protein [Mesorhizobium carmichaelinearum]|uniref:aminotransferase-like domain-containing protein n=1 Tax=Mesorhizobium carmichaelinearum TaxID=1208188 RepID=UPI000BA348D2|nr:PLP-dependent aminotransferase family protein [Mesorhizobium carmichaelinearum]
MFLKSPWEPRLSPAGGPIYQRLAAAITEDMINGKIPPGSRLPPHRDLSYRLGVGLGTVTKAYGLLERQGLASSVHGRGMFATTKSLNVDGIIDLSLNVPPNVISERLLSGTLQSLASSIDATTFGMYAPSQGLLEHRMALASWLQNFCASVDPERMILCSGGQHAISTVLKTLAQSRIFLIADELPFPGLIRIANLLKIKIHGAKTDVQGILPEDIERIAHSVNLRGIHPVLFANPTAQNPTGKTMSRSRIHDIAEICRRQQITVIEDDVYGAFAAPDRLCFLDLVPERTYYVNSLAKLLTPGLRLGALIAPTAQVDSLIHVIDAQGSAASPLSSFVMHKWVTDGVASHIAMMAQSETFARNELAASIFAPTADVHIGNGFHMFLRMPFQKAVFLAERAREGGILVTEPAQSLIPESNQSGIRLCLGGAPREQLDLALQKISSLHDEANLVIT